MVRDGLGEQCESRQSTIGVAVGKLSVWYHCWNSLGFMSQRPPDVWEETLNWQGFYLLPEELFPAPSLAKWTISWRFEAYLVREFFPKQQVFSLGVAKKLIASLWFTLGTQRQVMIQNFILPIGWNGVFTLSSRQVMVHKCAILWVKWQICQPIKAWASGLTLLERKSWR